MGGGDDLGSDAVSEATEIESVKRIGRATLSLGVDHYVQKAAGGIDDGRGVDADVGTVVAAAQGIAYRRAEIRVQENGAGAHIDGINGIAFSGDVSDVMGRSLILAGGDHDAGDDERLGIDLVVERDGVLETEARLDHVGSKDQPVEVGSAAPRIAGTPICARRSPPIRPAGRRGNPAPGPGDRPHRQDRPEVRRLRIPRRPDRALVDSPAAAPRSATSPRGSACPRTARDTAARLAACRRSCSSRNDTGRRTATCCLVRSGTPSSRDAGRVQEHMHRALRVAAQNDRLLAHARREEVARLRNLAFMPDEQPRAGEQLFQFRTIVLGRDEDLPADRAVLEVDHPISGLARSHRRPSCDTRNYGPVESFAVKPWPGGQGGGAFHYIDSPLPNPRANYGVRLIPTVRSPSPQRAQSPCVFRCEFLAV